MLKKVFFKKNRINLAKICAECRDVQNALFVNMGLQYTCKWWWWWGVCEFLQRSDASIQCTQNLKSKYLWVLNLHCFLLGIMAHEGNSKGKVEWTVHKVKSLVQMFIILHYFISCSNYSKKITKPQIFCFCFLLLANNKAHMFSQISNLDGIQ